MSSPEFTARLVWPMRRHAFVLQIVILPCLLAACGGGSSIGGSVGTPPPDIPTLTSISPSRATAGSPAVNLVLLGSNFETGATAQWNAAALATSWVNSTQLTATIPASDLASVASANVTVINPSPGGGTSAALTFTISAAPVANMWVKAVAGVATPQDLVWDSVNAKLYVSIGSTDTRSPNTIIPVNPMTGNAGTPVQAGNNPHLLSISSDSSYLWVGLDGDNSVQRFLLPALTKDISFPLPLNPSGSPQQPISLQAAPATPHTVAVVAGNWGYSPPGDGVYVYDDVTPRPVSVLGYQSGGSDVDWIQWGADNSVIYGNQYYTIDQGGVATLSVTPTGVSLVSYNGGQVDPFITQYDPANGLLYSNGAVFNPVDGSLVGTYDFPNSGNNACTADSSLGRYYCVIAFHLGGTDVLEYDLWVFALSSGALLNRVNFGVSAGQPLSSITGGPTHLVRWGNAGLAVTTGTGLFLIDGAAVNPAAPPDFSSGIPPLSYSWISSLTPQQAPAGSQDITVTINGSNFAPDSTACQNCSFLQLQYLPTTFVSPQQLKVTIPANLMANPGPLSISVFDGGASLFSTDSLTFTVASPVTNGTQVSGMDLAGLSLAWDSTNQLLYVGTADYDGAYPNSIVAINGNGLIIGSQTVGPDPYLLSVSADGQYLYAGYATATTMTQLQLPGLTSPITWTLKNPASSAVYTAGDLRAAPVNPHTTAATLFNLESSPDETGGVVIYDDTVERPDYAPGWAGGQAVFAIFDDIAWGSSDQILTGVCYTGDCFVQDVPLNPLYEFAVTPAGATFVTAAPSSFNQGNIHSDFGNGLIYSDDGNVADPVAQTIVGSYNASGLVAPDSSLNRVFILGQTNAQANSNNYTIESFDEKAFTSISSITISDLQGTPFELVRWGSSGLAVATFTGDATKPGLVYLIQNSTFVNNAQMLGLASSATRELVQCRWKRISKTDILRMLRKNRATNLP